jgi:hypothetical protein
LPPVEALLIFKLLLAMQSLLQPVSVSVDCCLSSWSEATCLDSSSSHHQTFIRHAVVVAAGRFLDFVVLCVLIMMPLASIPALLTFKLLLAMQSLLQRVGFSILLLLAF